MRISKRTTMSHCLVMLGLVALPLTAQSDTTSLFSRAQQNYIHRIEANHPIGAVDQDFAAFLLPQHFSGVELSRIEIAQGHNKTLKSIASGILSHSNRNNPITTTFYHPSSTKERQQIVADLSRADSQAKKAFEAGPALDTDTQFARLMNAHHERALAYAKEEKAYGRDPRLLKIARGMIKNQQQEHQEMMPLIQ